MSNRFKTFDPFRGNLVALRTTRKGRSTKEQPFVIYPIFIL